MHGNSVFLNITKRKFSIKRLICYCLLVGGFLLFLSGCSVLHVAEPLSPLLGEENSGKRQFYSTKALPNLPSILAIPRQFNQIDNLNKVDHEEKLHYCNWSIVIKSMTNNMLQTQNIDFGSILLIEEIINNDINFLLNLKEIHDILYRMIDDSKKFKLVSVKKISMVKRKLGLLPQDILGIRSKEIGIARNVGAKYVLYFRIIKDVSASELQMQLILTQSGEILWSEKALI